MARPKPADVATLAGGFIAGLSIPAALEGFYELAIRMLLVSYLLDVVDGWLARRYGSIGGFFLDRAFDRLSQVVAPGVLFVSWLSMHGMLAGTQAFLYSVYFAVLVTVAFWRLVMRGVRSLAYFSGLPLFTHALIMLASVIAGTPPDPWLLLALAAASAVPVPYFRRASMRGTPSPAPALRAGLLAILALLPYDSGPVMAAAKAIVWGVVVYAAVGPLPALVGLAPSPWGGGGGASGDSRPD